MYSIQLLPVKLPNVSNWNKNENYIITDLHAIKTRLNDTKNLLNPIFEKNDTAKRFTKLSNMAYKYESLRTSIIAQEFNAQHVSNAWMKFWEIANVFVEPMLATIEKSKSNEFNSFHVAEAPGSFVIS